MAMTELQAVYDQGLPNLQTQKSTARRPSSASCTRWEHEHVLEDVQRRLDENPKAMRTRRETVEHPFGTIKARMGATHFLMKRLHNVKTEMSLAVLGYNLTRVMNIIGIKPLIAAIREFLATLLAMHRSRMPSATFVTPYELIRCQARLQISYPQPPNHLVVHNHRTEF